MGDEEAGAEFIEQEGGDGPCSTLAGSCGMMVAGFILFPLALYLLGWNEQTYVCESSRIMYGEANTQAVGCSSQGVVNKFVYFSCPLVPASLQTFTMLSFDDKQSFDPGTAPPINFTSASGKQVVEMYLCRERCETKKRKNGAGQNVKYKTCRYSMDWSTSNIDITAKFSRPLADVAQGCPNIDTAGGNPAAPTNVQMGLTTEYATGVLAGDPKGAFALNQDLVAGLTPNAPVPLAPFQGRFAAGAKAATANQQPWLRPMVISKDTVTVQGNYLVTCAQPMLGCVRISFGRSDSTRPSVMTRVSSGGQTEKEPIPGSWGCKASTWQAILPEQVDKAGMVKKLHDSNKTKVWIIRLVGLFLSWMAIWCCFRPISAAAEVAGQCFNFLPCGGYIDDFLTGLVDGIVCLLSCGIGCSTGLFVIAIVWLYMRPLIGGSLLAASVLLCLCVVGIRSQATRQRPPKSANAMGAE
mmetsp:Transcript_107099/g.333839  ORF Transcript_107099/g.333839 Transcript_107099/m.333839 type:complete len:468 (+) Transcript_107099:110-1513(+)